MHSGDGIKSSITPEKKFKSVLIFGCLVLAVGLLGLILTGWYSRYMQDDYCFDFLLKHHGFWNAQVFTFFKEITFNGNRFSTNLLMGVLAALGPISARVLPGFIVMGWLAAGYFLMREINLFFGLNWMLPVLLFISEAVIFFTLALAPNSYQILYWRPGAVTYLMPLVFITMLFGLGLHFINRDQKTTGKLGLVGFFAFLAGGFSETAAVFLLGLLSFLFLFCIFIKPIDQRVHGILVRFLSAGLVGVLLSILVLLIAPSAQLRQVALFPHPPEFFTILQISVMAVWQFIVLTLYRFTTSSWLILVLFFFIGVGLPRSSPSEKPFGNKNPLKIIGLILLASLFLMICIAAPSAYASSSAPEERAMLQARFISVAAILSIAMLIGRWARQKLFSEKCAGVVLTSVFVLVAISTVLMLAVPAQKTFEPAYPEIRGWLMSNPWLIFCLVFIMLLSIFLILRGRNRSFYFATLFPVALLIIVILSSLGSLVSVYSALPQVRLKAQLWDWRETQIKAAIQKGQYEIILPALDSISGVTEFQPEADHWVNNCAELFYGMKSIRAVEPVLTHLPDL
jgi:hypothetical protein